MQPLITIYITNYNYGKYISRAIESVLSQSETSNELIIIDDGSTDDSKEIIERYRGIANISIVYQKNKGLNITNNIALSLSHGKYIMRLDADDYLLEDALQKLSTPLENDAELGLVFPDYYIVDADENIKEHHKRHDFKKEVTLFDQAAHGACTMIRVEFLKALGGYNENYKCQDGYELWIKFINKYKVTNVKEPLFSYRQHGDNLTSNENRILSTRAQINADYVKSLNLDNSSIAVIPIRSKSDKFYKLEINGETLLNIKIRQALNSTSVNKVIISCPDEEVRDTIDQKNITHSKVVFQKRTQELARINTSLNETIKEILIDETCSHVNSVILLDLRFPLISTMKIDDAVNTMMLFKANSLISVRPDNNLFFKHDGTGMKPILGQESRSKLERDTLYKHVGGITVVDKTSFLENEAILHGKVGHLILDKNSAYGIENSLDLTIVNEINKIYQLI